MKNLKQRILLLALALLSAFYSFAQDNTASQTESVSKSSSSTQAPAGGNWYAAPWVWIVGAALFILLLVAIVQAGNRSRG